MTLVKSSVEDMLKNMKDLASSPGNQQEAMRLIDDLGSIRIGQTAKKLISLLFRDGLGNLGISPTSGRDSNMKNRMDWTRG
ncbi:MAG: hypothetical protein ACFFFC_14475 [Candidatus Thorarchaeota archaeon]